MNSTLAQKLWPRDRTRTDIGLGMFFASAGIINSEAEDKVIERLRIAFSSRRLEMENEKRRTHPHGSEPAKLT
jgi:hypothetical protein